MNGPEASERHAKNLERLTAREKMLDAATKTPWSVADENGLMEGATPAWCVSQDVDGEWHHDLAYMPQSAPQDGFDAEAIAALRNTADDVGALLRYLIEAHAPVDVPEWGPVTPGQTVCRAGCVVMSTSSTHRAPYQVFPCQVYALAESAL